MKDDRERLLSETLVSLQRLAVPPTTPASPASTSAQPLKAPHATRPTAGAAPRVDADDGMDFGTPTTSPPILPPAPRLPIQDTKLREDIRARVDAFKARQHALQADRDAYYEQVIRRVRAVTKRWD
jgi:hypothetical protein